MDKAIFAVLSISLYICVCAVNDLELENKFVDGNQCTTKLEQCSLKIRDKDLVMLKPGQKGDEGPPGERGDKGETGANGPPGPRGPDGAVGEKGPSGRDGFKGNTGDTGEPGQKGDDGVPGNPGENCTGTRGDQGIKGAEGPPGPAGVPGLPGICPCFKILEPCLDGGDGEPVSRDPLGTINNPFNDICKNVDFNEESEYIYIGPNIKVKCEKKDRDTWTCIPPNERIFPNISADTLEEKIYWLSTKGVTIKDIYNLTPTQVTWIQNKSVKAFQKIIYHCKNSVPYDPDHEDISLLLLSWNDIRFGPTPQESTPFVYNVTSNGCLNSAGEASTSVIEIQTNFAPRLPVVDFLVRDLRDKYEEIGVEHSELCFH